MWVPGPYVSPWHRLWSSENPSWAETVICLFSRLYLASEWVGGGGGKGRNPRQLWTGGEIGRLIWQCKASRFADRRQKMRKRDDEDKEEWRKNQGEVEQSDLNLAGGSTLRLGWHKDRSASIKGSYKKVKAVRLQWLHARCDVRLFILLSAMCVSHKWLPV